MKLEQLQAIAAKRTRTEWPIYFTSEKRNGIEECYFAKGPVHLDTVDLDALELATRDQNFVYHTERHIDALLRVVEAAEYFLQEIIGTEVEAGIALREIPRLQAAIKALEEI